jgi:hypothetical protein
MSNKLKWFELFTLKKKRSKHELGFILTFIITYCQKYHPSVRPMVETVILTVHWPHPLFSSIQFPLVSVRRRPRPGHWPVPYSLLKASKTTAYNKVPPSEPTRYRPALTRLRPQVAGRLPASRARCSFVATSFSRVLSLSLSLSSPFSVRAGGFVTGVLQMLFRSVVFVSAAF